MSDLIERQAAIDALRREYNTDDSDYPTEYQLGLSAGRRIIDELLSAQFIEPEQKTGKWEIYVISMIDGEGCRCSECGYEGAPHWNYCPNCGAKMEV